MNARRRRRRPSAYRGKKIQVNFFPVIVIICLSVCAGYLTAKYVVCPVLGYEPAGLSVLQEKDDDGADEANKAVEESSEKAESDPSVQKETSGGDDVIEDQVKVKQTSGYALQFGSYSTREAAEKSVKELKNSGIETKVIEKDGAYKVIGEIFDTKDEANDALSELDESVGAFVASVGE